MAGTAKNYDITTIHQGPGDLWIIGTPPTDTAVRLTLATDGTPDATAHPQSVCLGLTEAGVTFSIKTKPAPIKADQFEAPIDSYQDELDGMLEAELSQQSVDLLQNALTVGTYATVVSPGYKQLTFGGTSIIPTVCVAAIAPKRSGSGLFIVSMLYRASVVGGIQALMSRAKKSMHKIQFSGQSDISRTTGKQIGVHYETL